MITPRLPATWVVLALVPSSLMLSVTTYATTDIAPVPILWVVPLALYLLSFVLVFARRTIISVGSASLALVVLGGPLLVAMAVRQIAPAWLLIPLHLVTFFAAALVCHGRLAASRPPAVFLTEFYLWVSIGGVAGGLFNTLVAPLVFHTTLEYPLGLFAAFMLRPGAAANLKIMGEGWRRRWAVAAPVLFVIVLVAGLLVAKRSGAEWKSLAAAGTLFGGLAAFGAATWRGRAYPAIAAGLLVFASLVVDAQDGSRLHVERNFFGVKTVRNSPDGAFRQFLHGNTLHGIQSLASSRRTEPTGYYDRTGPLGDVFGSTGMQRAGLRVAVLGLGTGGMGCYASPGQQWTFYEIDPAVERIAREARFFTYLRDCAPGSRVILGDARLSIAAAADGEYDVIALDVFSSDAIPMHLLTAEALQLYLRKLRAPGLLLFHISNRYLELAPVLGGLLGNAGLTGIMREDQDRRRGSWPAGKQPSIWAVAAGAKDTPVLRQLTAGPDSRWRALSRRPSARPWTDDYSNLLSALKW